MLCVGLLLFAPQAAAHGLKLSLLSLAQADEQGTFAVAWKVPVSEDGLSPALTPRFPSACQVEGRGPAEVTPAFKLTRSVARCPGLAGLQAGVAFDGEWAAGDQVLVQVRLLDGKVLTSRLDAGARTFQLPERPAPLAVFRSYLKLGAEHIASGYDHLLFVLGLVLLVRTTRALVATVTSFTLAHSLTLTFSTLDLVKLPSAPVEAIIALSILALGAQLLRPGQDASSSAAPWRMAFIFGLLHGFAFAGALGELGLPPGQAPLALFSFNVGVELGQLAFVGLALGCRWVCHRLRVRGLVHVRAALAHAVGIAGAFWLLERLAFVVLGPG